MPSQANVEVDIYSWGLNIFVNTLASDANHTYGLCGNFDLHKNNEFIHHATGINYYPMMPDTKVPKDFTDQYRYCTNPNYAALLKGEITTSGRFSMGGHRVWCMCTNLLWSKTKL